MHLIHPKIRLCECSDLLREVISETYLERSRISIIGAFVGNRLIFEKHSIIDVRVGSKYTSGYIWKTCKEKTHEILLLSRKFKVLFEKLINLLLLLLIFREAFRTLPNIYDGAFLRK